MLAALTDHARIRMQQRGIPHGAVDLLLDYGRETRAGKGGRIVSFDKRSRRRVIRELGREALRLIERYRDAYAVVGADDAIVTVGHRQRRFEER
jgi:hypothetical protein